MTDEELAETEAWRDASAPRDYRELQTYAMRLRASIRLLLVEVARLRALVPLTEQEAAILDTEASLYATAVADARHAMTGECQEIDPLPFGRWRVNFENGKIIGYTRVAPDDEG